MYGADCEYGLKEVSEKRKREVRSNLERRLREFPERTRGPHKLRIIT